MSHHVLGIAGSLRADSYNARLVEHAAAVAPDRLTVEPARHLVRLPLFDEDLEASGPPPEVEAMWQAVAAADGLLLATPEYNFGVSAPMKNWLDWASRPPRRGPLVGKPVAVMGASTGMVGGTVQAQGQLRVALAVLGAHVMPTPPVLVQEAGSRFEGGDLTHDPTGQLVRLAMERFADHLDRFSSS